MSWEDRDYNRGGGGGAGEGGFGRPGGDWQGIRPAFDNPLTWSVRMGRFFGIEVRVHVVLLLFILAELFRSLGAADEADAAPLDTFWTIIWLGGLFAIVLLHEFGHVFACRSTGGDADEILMWPLGGLAFCAPPHRWRAHAWTVIGGPLVNVVIAIVLGVVLGIATGSWWRVAIPVPFTPIPYLESAWLQGVMIVAWANMILLVFNLLPMFPLDGGRLLASLLWPKLGYVRSMRISLRIGYIAAICLGLVAILTSNLMLGAVAIFGGITCYHTHKQLQFTEEMMGFEYDEYALNLGREVDEAEAPPEPSKRELKKAQKRAEAEARDAEELDRILKKIAEEGMESLSSREKRWLQAHSRRKQD